jgi:hypothetical protein
MIHNDWACLEQLTQRGPAFADVRALRASELSVHHVFLGNPRQLGPLPAQALM